MDAFHCAHCGIVKHTVHRDGGDFCGQCARPVTRTQVAEEVEYFDCKRHGPVRPIQTMAGPQCKLCIAQGHVTPMPPQNL